MSDLKVDIHAHVDLALKGDYVTLVQLLAFVEKARWEGAKLTDTARVRTGVISMRIPRELAPAVADAELLKEEEGTE